MRGRPKGTKETADREQPWIITCEACKGSGEIVAGNVACNTCNGLGYINTKNKKQWTKKNNTPT